IPGAAGPQLPGFIGWMAGTVVPRKPPVSVIHHVSVITASRLPTSSKYQRHASGSIGSPTVVMDLKWYLYLRGSSGLSFRSMRMAVGAVWKLFRPRRSAMRHGRPALGRVRSTADSTLVASAAG